jgi:hypothetical protein
MNAPEYPPRLRALAVQLEAFAAAPGLRGRLLLAAVTLIMLWAGLDPKGYRFRNEVEWIEGRAGVRFGRFGRVETEPFLSREQAAALNQGGYALELALDPSPDPLGGLRVLASFHGGVDVSQLVVCQWLEHLIVMNGDDYDHSRRLPRVAADPSKSPDGPLMLTINSTPKGTSLYLNGEAVATNANLHLTLPSGPEPGRLVLGNSVSASQPWSGVISYFSLLPRPLTASEVESRWRTRGGPFDSTAEALLLYRFEEASERTVHNHGSLAAPLTIPSRLHALGRRFLLGAMPGGIPSDSLMLDVLVNFIGFMPFGVALAIVLRSSHRSPRRILLVTAVVGFALSLAIELTQAWMPSRNSNLWDLLLNTAGAPFGAWLWLVARRRLSRLHSGQDRQA